MSKDDEPIRLTHSMIEEFARDMRVEPEDYHRLLGTFITCNEERIETLVQALEGNDPDAAQGAVHSIKGTASTLRISWMADVAARIESAVRAGECSGHERDVDMLRKSLEAARNDAISLGIVPSATK